MRTWQKGKYVIQLSLTWNCNEFNLNFTKRFIISDALKH